MSKSVQKVPYQEELKIAVKRFVALNLGRVVAGSMDDDDLDSLSNYVGELVIIAAQEAMDELSTTLKEFADDMGVRSNG